MIIDIIVIILLIMALFKGLIYGMVRAVFSFLAFIIGIAAAIKLSAIAAATIGENVNISQRWLPVLAFFLVFILVAFVVRLGARFVENVVELAMLGWVNRLFGVLLYTLLYIFIFSVLLFYGEQLGIFKPKTMEASVTYPFIRSIAPGIINAVGTLVPFFRDMFPDLEQFFDAASANKPAN